MNKSSNPIQALHHTQKMFEDEPHPANNAIRDTVIQRSEAVEEIISRKSGFTERWALLVFLSIFFVIVTIAWMVKYPDVIETEGVLTSSNFPKEIIIVQSGRIKKLFANNNKMVKNGEILGWMETTADYQSVIIVRQQIDKAFKQLNQGQIDKALNCFDDRQSNLGEIQKDYQDFVRSLQQFRDYRTNGYYIKRHKMLNIDIQHIKEENLSIQQGKLLAEKDLKVAEATFKMNTQLFEEHVTAEEEFRKAQSSYLAKHLAMYQYSASIIANKTRLNDKQKEIDQLLHDFSQQEIIFEQSLQTFTSTIDEWIKEHLLVSPIDGKLTFILPIEENQHMSQGKVIGYVDPVTNQNIFIELNLPQHNFGKIDTGMKVHMRFQAYPYQEFGYVLGSIAYISNIPSDSGFLATAKLDQALVTNKGLTLPYKDRLKLNARIITKDMRLLERLYYNMIKSF